MQSDNPELVQPENWLHPTSNEGTATPIFLIHDGGGTTFAYHCLGQLQRLIYGISNPRFFTGERFNGGLAEMGELYAGWIQETVSKPDFSKRRGEDSRVDIYLGGWSLGGSLSLEVAKRLADDENINVVGILMVDTVYPDSLAPPQTTSPSEDGLSKNEILAERCMAEARRMERYWKIPTWDGVHAGKRPSAVLLRATGYILPSSTDGSPVHRLDTSRKDKMLGWGQYDANMFDAVFDVEGHHFDLFTFSRVDATTEVIRRGLQKLDDLTRRKGKEGGSRGNLKVSWESMRV